jgi:acetolactate synthase-1/2/3 large subunit
VTHTSVRPGTVRRDGGRLIAERLRAHGVSRLFTLSAGHLFPLFDGCRHAGIDLVDVRHESSAAVGAGGGGQV